MKRLLALATLLASGPALAGHPWGGVDLCEARRDTVPPGIAAALLPEPDSTGAALLQRYCTQCHNLPGPGRHQREEWPAVLARMETLMQVSRFYRGLLGPVAMPDPQEQAALRAYLERHALRPLPPAAGAAAPDERAYRAACGDCHAAPDPRHYAAADWPALLARMDAHRTTMGRPPLGAALTAAVERFSAAAAGPRHGGSGHDAAVLPPAQPTTVAPWGRWLSLGVFFGLAALGLWRWARRTPPLAGH